MIQYITDIAQAATAVIAVCAAMATVLPPPKDDGPLWYTVLHAVVNAVGLNLGHASNKEQK